VVRVIAAEKHCVTVGTVNALVPANIFSAGGLMDKDTAQAYKSHQKLLNPVAVK
jgi:hypothetical protein